MDARPSLLRFDGASTLELVLPSDNGVPWVLSLSAGMERFIGAYPRIDGFGAGAPLLAFRPAGQPA